MVVGGGGGSPYHTFLNAKSNQGKLYLILKRIIGNSEQGDLLRQQIMVKMSATEQVDSHRKIDFSRYIKVN